MIVGRLARSQLNQEQVRVYVNEENNRRRNLLQKYIRLCNDAKVLRLCTLCWQLTTHEEQKNIWQLGTHFRFHAAGNSGDDAGWEQSDS